MELNRQDTTSKAWPSSNESREAVLVQRRVGADMAAGDGKHRRADVHTGHLEPLTQGAKVVAGAAGDIKPGSCVGAVMDDQGVQLGGLGGVVLAGVEQVVEALGIELVVNSCCHGGKPSPAPVACHGAERDARRR
jgi:hypothetical protein